MLVFDRTAFWKILEHSQKTSCHGQLQINAKRTPWQVYSWETCKIFLSTILPEHLKTTVFDVLAIFVGTGFLLPLLGSVTLFVKPKIIIFGEIYLKLIWNKKNCIFMVQGLDLVQHFWNFFVKLSNG